MGIFSEKKGYPGGNVANNGQTGPDMQIFSPITFENFEINLEPHNGFKHVLGYVVHLAGKARGKEEPYDIIEKLMVCMQRDGYEILDVKPQDITTGETLCRSIFSVIIYK